MKVEELPHYGQDLLSIQRSTPVSLHTRLALFSPVLAYGRSLARTLGLMGARQAFKDSREEFERLRSLDWESLKQRGLSQTDFDAILKEMAVAKTLACRLGLKKAAQIRHRWLQASAYLMMEELFAPPEVFVECGGGDFLPPFKQYYHAFMDAMARAGLAEAAVTEDTPDVFQVNVTYCAWAEVARALGNPRYCYYFTCYGDEVFFPRFCERAGFRFERGGTLAQCETCCDHRFVRVQDGGCRDSA